MIKRHSYDGIKGREKALAHNGGFQVETLEASTQHSLPPFSEISIFDLEIKQMGGTHNNNGDARLLTD